MKLGRAVKSTVLASLLGGPIAALPLLSLGPLGYLLATLFVFPLYLIAVGIFLWPATAILQRFKGFSRLWVVSGSATITALVSTQVGLSVGVIGADQPALTLVWFLSAVAAGAASGWVLWSRGIDFDRRTERQADLYEAQNADGMRYRAFFSYARADEKIASWLWNRLDTYKVPPELIRAGTGDKPLPSKLNPIFRDRFDLSAGGRVSEQLVSALKKSERLIVLCSPRSAASKWVDYEVQAFIDAGREDKILPVIAPGDSTGESVACEYLPPSLRQADLIAADLRNQKTPHGQIIGDGRHDGALKLIAGLLDVPFDHLVRREHQRQRRQVVVLAAATSFSAALAAASLLFAYISLGAFEWTRNAIDKSVEADFRYIAELYRADGVEPVKAYLAAQPADSIVCSVLFDSNKNLLAGNGSTLVPLPDEVGSLKRYSVEFAEQKNYGGSFFNFRSDGLVQRLSTEHTLATGSCNYEPPHFYGVYQALFAPAPDLTVKESHSVE